jgi:hypothetical protein
MPLPSQVARPPVGQNNQNRLDLMKRQEQLDVPTDPNAIDPKTGKPMFKMGLGQRILGTFANFASGFGGRGGDPVYVGPGATNWKFGRAENLRKENLAGVQSELGNQEKLDQSQEKSYADLVKAAFEGQIAEARKGTATAQQENAETRRQLEASQAEKNAADAELKRTKAGQEPEAKTEPEIALALQMAILKGDKAGVQKYRGALNELSRQKSAGKDTTAADIAKAIQVAEYRGRELDKVDKAQEEERKARYTELDKNVVLRVNLDKRAAAQAAIDQELKTKYAPKAQAVHDAADQMLGLTKAGGVLKSAPSSAHKVPPRVGETILVDGKPRKVVGWNGTTKKPIVERN